MTTLAYLPWLKHWQVNHASLYGVFTGMWPTHYLTAHESTIDFVKMLVDVPSLHRQPMRILRLQLERIA